MAVTFEQIMDFHPDNRCVYDKIRDSLEQLLPFVGAGLTADVYGTWGAALKALGGKLTDPASIAELDELLAGGEYFDAAQLLEERRGTSNFARDLVGYFSSDKLYADWGTVKRGAVWLLPDLFRCPLLTTNFDQAVELLFRERGTKGFEVLDPFSPDLRGQASRLMHDPCVFKLHGTVVGSMVDGSRVVFTSAQYDEHYGLGGDAREALKDFIGRRALLFLGCGLRGDMTMDVLREAAGLGVTHFAIVSCGADERDERIRELADAGVRAIVYEEGRHESTRVILEKLLEDIDPDAYRLLEHKASALPDGTDLNPYLYDSGMTPLVGREREVDPLLEFVTSTDDAFRWWALTGPGGSGKSRLAHELRRRVGEMPDWVTYKLDQYDYDDLTEALDGLRQSTLVVADYVQAHARELGECMGRLATRPRATRLRLLLLEREGDSVEDAIADDGWTSQLLGAARHSKGKVLNLVWKLSFLALDRLSGESLLSIVGSFASALREKGLSTHRVPTEQEREMLVGKLEEVDPGLRRPLYALLLTGAWMAGENPCRWDRERVLDYVTDRELERLRDHVRGTVDGGSGKRDMVIDACMGLLRTATVLCGARLGEVRELCRAEWGVLTRAAGEEWLDTEGLLRKLGLVQGDVLAPVEPDLVGEYLVCRWFCDEAKEDQREVFVNGAWTDQRQAAIFFLHLLRDYKFLLDEAPGQWDALVRAASEGDGLAPDQFRFRARLLAGIVATCEDPSIKEQSVRLLEVLHSKHPDDLELPVDLAWALSSLAGAQSASCAAETVRKLVDLAERHPQDVSIARALAWAFAARARSDDAETTRKDVGQILDLLDAHPDDEGLVVPFAWTLVSVLTKPELVRDVKSAHLIVGVLESLLNDYPDNDDLATALGRGLLSLLVTQDASTELEVVDTLCMLLAAFPDNPYQTQALAIGLETILSDLAGKQDEPCVAEATALLEGCLDKYSGNSEIVQLLMVAINGLKGMLGS